MKVFLVCLAAAVLILGVVIVATGGPTTTHCVHTATGTGDYCYDSPGGGGGAVDDRGGDGK
jgi:hypothetical protein